MKSTQASLTVHKGLPNLSGAFAWVCPSHTHYPKSCQWSTHTACCSCKASQPGALMMTTLLGVQYLTSLKWFWQALSRHLWHNVAISMLLNQCSYFLISVVKTSHTSQVPGSAVLHRQVTPMMCRICVVWVLPGQAQC